jgi:UDPglucose--hexose-1-phosphate uridylyltransferase
MSLLRFDPTTADWVVFAPSRKFRPHERGLPSAEVAPAVPPNCPFCPGNEALTPPEIYRVWADGNAHPTKWRVRVVPNKFPALRIEESPNRITEDESFQYMRGCGAHEVIIESPEHFTPLAQQPVEQIECVLKTLQGRYNDLMGDRRFQTVIIFKNHGEKAGTSLTHPHWQLIATPVVPRLLRQMHFEATEYFDRTGECIYCELLQSELASGRRIIARNEGFVALMPYASHMPFETWILPLALEPSFRVVKENRLRLLAILLKEVLLKLYTALDNPAYNLTIDDVPRGDEDKEYFLWHIRILPRLTTPAGFELGSGMSINTVMPEDAAAFLMEAPTVPANGVPTGMASTKPA